jgi:hypothetical protein
MSTWREAVLSGVSRAAEVHSELGLKAEYEDGSRALDLIPVFQSLDLPLIFRPLKGLLGAYVPVGDEAGVMVTTGRSLHIQRFTAAHELGHHVLNHQVASLDADVGFVARGERNGHDLQEVAADAFAAEFLMPRWLLMAQIRRQNWRPNDLATPQNVYQLSLRLGTSYQATCWALLSNKILPPQVVNSVSKVPPKESKQRLLKPLTPENWHPDVWLLSECDSGAHLVGNPDDYVVVTLKEHLASGHSWHVDVDEMSIASDDRLDAGDGAIGASVQRKLTIRPNGPGTLKMSERRTWELTNPLARFSVQLAFEGSEDEGLPRAEKRSLS